MGGADICCVGLEFRKAGQWDSLFLFLVGTQDSSYRACLYMNYYHEQNFSRWFIRHGISYFYFLTYGCVPYVLFPRHTKAIPSQALFHHTTPQILVTQLPSGTSCNVTHQILGTGIWGWVLPALRPNVVSDVTRMRVPHHSAKLLCSRT